MNCKICKHWDANGEASNIEASLEANHRKCLRVKRGNFEGMHWDIDKEVESEPAIVIDGEGYKAELWTLETFGCGLYEERSEVVAARESEQIPCYSKHV